MWNEFNQFSAEAGFMFFNVYTFDYKHSKSRGAMINRAQH